MKRQILAWLISAKGATAIEYSLIAAGIAVTIMIAVFSFGSGMGDLLNDLADYLPH